MTVTLLGANEIREIATSLDLHPAKSLGQNFVIDANTCQKIVRFIAEERDEDLISLTSAISANVDRIFGSFLP